MVCAVTARIPLGRTPPGLKTFTGFLKVKEIVHPLPTLTPILVRHGIVRSGLTVPNPERHPYCEFGVLFRGQGIEFVEGEEGERRPGDLFLAGPGIPHWFRATLYPIHFATIYFSPSLLIELGPKHDGITLLRRFTATQSMADRMVRPPAALYTRVRRAFKQMIVEFNQRRFGSEVRLRTLLMDSLVAVARWEMDQGKEIGATHLASSWKHVDQALRYLAAHFADPIYAKQVAAAAMVSETRLKSMFRELLGITWCQYLKGYRIHRAAAILGEPGSTVTETALTVGFESISHFDATFRSFMGASPRDYSRNIAHKRT